MKTLHLMRHAKSSWSEPQLEDWERTLNKRGREDAPRMGAELARTLAPMVVHVSPARRAQLTLAGLCEGWPALGGFAHVTEEPLYTFSDQALLDWLAGFDDDQPGLFLIAHNPALTELTNFLLGESYLANLPTAGYVQLELEIDRWADIRQGCSRVADALFPRQL